LEWPFALLDNSTNKIELKTEDDLLSDIQECVTIFKKSESIHWIKEDFVNEVLHLEIY